MQPYTTSAPGKVILFGEHSVVYGRAALAMSLSLKSSVAVSPSTTNRVTWKTSHSGVGDLEMSWTPEELHFEGVEQLSSLEEPAISEQLSAFIENKVGKAFPLSRSLKSFLFLYVFLGRNEVVEPCTFSVKSDVPLGAGLGSSAAYNTSLTLAVLNLFKVPGVIVDGAVTSDGRSLIQKYSYLCEKFMHGNPSGLDNTVATYGGLLSFKSGELKPLKSALPINIIITSTNVERNTQNLTGAVKATNAAFPEVMSPLFDSVDAISKKALSIFLQEGATTVEQRVEAEKQLEQLIFINQHLLGAMGVGHESLDRIARTSAKYNLYSKLTGAGGGGCAFTLIRSDTSPETVQNFLTDLRSEGFTPYELQAGHGGVSIAW